VQWLEYRLLLVAVVLVRVMLLLLRLLKWCRCGLLLVLQHGLVWLLECRVGMVLVMLPLLRQLLKWCRWCGLLLWLLRGLCGLFVAVLVLVLLLLLVLM
jgi:hypothetical protein